MNDTPPPKSKIVTTASGILFALTSLVCMMLGTFVLGKLHAYANNPRNKGTVDLDAMPAMFVLLIEHRFLYVILCAPALASGVLLAAGIKPRSLWYMIGLLSVLLMVGTLLGSFISWIAPLYEYQDL